MYRLVVEGDSSSCIWFKIKCDDLSSGDVCRLYNIWSVGRSFCSMVSVYLVHSVVKLWGSSPHKPSHLSLGKKKACLPRQATSGSCHLANSQSSFSYPFFFHLSISCRMGVVTFFVV